MSIIFKDCQLIDRHGNAIPLNGVVGNYYTFSLTREYECYLTEDSIPEHRYYKHLGNWYYKGAYGTSLLKPSDITKEFETTLLLMGITT